ncbi:hypothetical protein PsYK624_137510 [Phanerochaete sordida]|uniref:MFS general substrate transporter n=1 Tax=Phanerochaete sordida TaxID=48140 RepID=A0A9P3GQ71_9APHY|nr:hypothetical protein PsYK624_137510 [Phanerochaete sordida]
MLSYISEWFVCRRGLACGIVNAADSVGGVLFPVVFPPLIARCGIKNTTRIYAAALAVCLLPCALFMHPRLPEPRWRAPAQTAIKRSWIRDRRFWVFIVINTLQGFAHYIPLIWLPTFAVSLGRSTSQGSLALTLSNTAALPAAFVMGWLSDRMDIWALAFCVSLLSALATFTLWGVAAASYAGILAFGVVYGVTAGTWSSLWSGFVRPIAKGDPAVAATIINCMMLSRGIGNILSTPISTALQSVKNDFFRTANAHAAGLTVDGGRFSAVILFTGGCFAAGAIVTVVGWVFSGRRCQSTVDESPQ